MRLTCPSCAASYEVPDVKVRAGMKRVRCARCGHQWTFEPTPLPIDIPPLTPMPAPEDEPPAVPPPSLPLSPSINPTLAGGPLSPMSLSTRRVPADARPGRPIADPARTAAPTRLAGLAWLLSVALLAACAVAAVVWHEDVVRAWPAAERAYRAIGLS